MISLVNLTRLVAIGNAGVTVIWGGSHMFCNSLRGDYANALVGQIAVVVGLILAVLADYLVKPEEVPK